VVAGIFSGLVLGESIDEDGEGVNDTSLDHFIVNVR